MKLRRSVAGLVAGSSIFIAGCDAAPVKSPDMTTEQQAQLTNAAKHAANAALDAYVKLTAPGKCDNSSTPISAIKCTVDQHPGMLDYETSSYVGTESANDENNVSISFIEKTEGSNDVVDVYLDRSVTEVDSKGKELPDQLKYFTPSSGAHIQFVRPHSGSPAANVTEFRRIMDDPKLTVQEVGVQQTGEGLGSDYSTSATIIGSRAVLTTASYNSDKTPSPAGVPDYIVNTMLPVAEQDVPTA